MSDKVELTERELSIIKDQAVMKSQIDELTNFIPQIFSELKIMGKAIADVPMEMVKCRDELDKDMKTYVHGRFITDIELERFESKLETKVTEELSKVSMRINKAQWVVSAFISAATFLLYILTKTSILT